MQTSTTWALTHSAFIWTRVLAIPFWALFNLLPVILYKELDASPLACAAMLTLKPCSSLFSSYWGLSIHKRPDLLRTNLILTNTLKFLPFLFFPFINQLWYFIFCFAFFMMLSRGGIPAWMETLKTHVPDKARETTFATGSLIDYLGGALLPFLFGWILDGYHDGWRWLFFGAAGLGALSSLWLIRLPKISIPESTHLSFNFKQWVVKPWKQSFELLKERPDFAWFQLGFMLGGGGLMIMQPVLPVFFVDVLSLSYTEMLIALSICKGIGYAVTTPLWIKLFRKDTPFQFSSMVTALSAVFACLLLSSSWSLMFLYLAYACYGMMVAGSDMVWNLSGPLFAKDEDSSHFSRTNILTVGLRGALLPPLGGLLVTFVGSSYTLIVGGIFCLSAAWVMKMGHNRFSEEVAEPVTENLVQ